MVKYLLLLGCMISLNSNTTVVGGSLKEVLQLLKLLDNYGCSTCTKLQDGVFLGVFHGTNTHGFTPSQTVLSPSEPTRCEFSCSRVRRPQELKELCTDNRLRPTTFCGGAG